MNIKPNPKYITVTYINRADVRFSIEIACENQLDNLMEIIRDYGYEDWGECRGRAWCKTCHVSTNLQLPDVVDSEEEYALQDVVNRQAESRLACQIQINEALDGMVVTYRGDN